MGLLDLHADEMLGAARDTPLVAPPAPRRSVWAQIGGFGTAAPRGIAAGAAESTGFAADVLGAFGQVLGAYPEAMGPVPLTPAQRREADAARRQVLQQGVDFSSEAGDLFRGVARDYAPDPMTASFAEQTLFNLARVGGKAVGYALGAGPVAGAALLAGDEGLAAADALRQEGVDLATRTKAGAVAGVAAGASVLLPVAGRTLPQTLGLVAAGGPGAFAAQQAATRQILQSAGYDHLAEQYDPFDPVGLALSTLIPAAFGAFGLRANRARAAAQAAEDFRTGPVPSGETPTAAAAREAFRPEGDHVDAARVLLAVEQRQRASPFAPDDWRAYDVHEAALNRAIDQMARGEPVRVNDTIATPDLTTARTTLAQIDALQAERTDLLPVAANLAERGAIRDARQELALMEQQRPDTTEAGLRGLAKEIQAQDGVSYKAALADAKRRTDAAVADFEARQQRLNAAIETNARAQQATQRINELDQRITDLQKQLGPAANLATFEHALRANIRAIDEQIPKPRRTQTTAEPAPARPAPPEPQAAAPGGAGRAPLPAGADGARPGPAGAAGRLVEDTAAAAARLQDVAARYPDLQVQLDGMDGPGRLSDVLAAAQREADDLKADGDLMQVAAQCALLNGV